MLKFTTALVVGLFGFTLYSQAAPPKPRSKPQPAPVKPQVQLAPESCSKIAELLKQIESELSAAASHGDKAEKMAKDFLASHTITSDESQALYDETKSLEKGAEKMMETVRQIDNLIPGGREVKLQLMHLKVALVMEPIRPFAILLVQRMMTALVCNIDATLPECQAQAIAPVYTERYGQFKTKAAAAISGLREFLKQNACSADCLEEPQRGASCK